MNTTSTRFYVTGGTLRQDAPSYVERRADRDLCEGLSRGEYCYVLTSRQMGKSSLMVHTAGRLREDGVTVVILDLTAIGQNVTAEQWYGGLLLHLGRQLDLEDDLEDYWLDNDRLGPLQRWMAAVEGVVLKADERRETRDESEDVRRTPTGTLASRLSPLASKLVLFIDEIDAVRSLPFSTDEFFAALRHCYNRRNEEPTFNRLTFCLLGVATPSDLIQDTRTTPFNIGRRIELTDFTESEAIPLAKGLGRGQRQAAALLQRALYWTGGHPYLTQRLCQALAENGSVTDAAGVDRLCEALFLSPRSRERDDNLLFVRDRLLHGEADVTGLLKLYALVCSPRGKVPDDETNQLVSALRLSGIVREREGFLQVRNRIYARVFDRQWVAANMPDAELRRLRALAREEARKRRLAEERERAVRRNLYVSDMNLAQQAWEVGHVARALELLEAHRPEPGQEDLRNFEWRYLWRRCRHGDSLYTWTAHQSEVRWVGFSPDGAILASGSLDGTVKLWEVATKQEVASLEGHHTGLFFAAFSPDGRKLITEGDDHLIKSWDLASRREVTAYQGDRTQGRGGRALSPDGRTLAVGTNDGTVKLLDVARKRITAHLVGHTRGVICAAFSPDGKLLATGSFDQSVRLWDVAAKREVASFTGYHGGVGSVAFSSDGRTSGTGSYDGLVKLWDIATARLLATLKGHKGWVDAVAFSPDGQLLASVGDTARVWDVAEKRELYTLRGHRGNVNCVAFSPDGSTLATGSADQTVKLWPAGGESHAGILRGHTDDVWCLAFSPEGQILATGSYDTTVRLWDIATEQQIALLEGHQQPVACVAFSPDGKILATGTGAWNAAERPGELKLWDVAGRQELLRLPPQKAAVQSLTFSPDGQWLATRNSDGTARLWDVATWEEAVTFVDEKPTDMPWTSAVLFSPDGKILVSGAIYDETTVKLWDVPKRRKIADLVMQAGGISSGAFSRDGKTLAFGCEQGSVALWDVTTRRLITHLKEAAGVVYSVAFSSDGKTLAAGYLDSTVRLWDMATQRQVTTLDGHENTATAVAFSADSSLLASASADDTIRLWRAATIAETDAPPGAAAAPTAPARAES